MGVEAPPAPPTPQLLYSSDPLQPLNSSASPDIPPRIPCVSCISCTPQFPIRLGVRQGSAGSRCFAGGVRVRGSSGEEGALPHPAAEKKIPPARRNGASPQGPTAPAGEPLPGGTPPRTGPAKLGLLSTSL